jgi:hypothetical protein
MSTVPKSRSGLSNKTVYILLAVAVIIVLLFIIILMYLVLKSLPGSDGGMNVKSGQGDRVGGTFHTGEKASLLKPDEVMKAFLNELSQEQTEDAYQRTSRGFQSSMSQNDFNTMINKNKALIRWEFYRIKGRTGGGSTLTYRGHVGGGPNGACDFTMEIGQESEGWRITKFTVP